MIVKLAKDIHGSEKDIPFPKGIQYKFTNRTDKDMEIHISGKPCYKLSPGAWIELDTPGEDTVEFKVHVPKVVEPPEVVE